VETANNKKQQWQAIGKILPFIAYITIIGLIVAFCNEQ